LLQFSQQLLQQAVTADRIYCIVRSAKTTTARYLF